MGIMLLWSGPLTIMNGGPSPLSGAQIGIDLLNLEIQLKSG